MSNQRKRGKLSVQEMAYIKQNCFDLSLEEMSKALNRTIEPIKKYIAKENLKARDLSDHEHLLNELRDKYYYRELTKQMDDSEIMFFEHQWIDFYVQFNEDVLHTEELQILEMIRTEILINRSMADRHSIMEQIEIINDLINTEMDKDESMRDPVILASWQTQLGSLIGSKSSYINEHEKLVTKKERFLKDLKATREQRKRVAEDANTNFTLWIRTLQELEKKRDEGFDMEVHARAADKARERLSEYHTYEDGEVDQPLLNSDTVKKED